MIVITIPLILSAMMIAAQPQPIRLGVPRGEVPTKVEPYRPVNHPPQLTTQQKPSEK